jgi:membrane fusion protein (multidrug efflux system)
VSTPGSAATAGPAAPAASDALYRSEAVGHFRWRGAEGEVLRSTPTAIRRAHNVVVAFVVTALVFACVFKVNRFSTGPLVVRVDGRDELTALTGGTVAEVRVRPGERVKKGDVLVRFHAEALEAELARVQREYDDRVRARLRDLNDDMSRTALVSLRASLDLAERKLAEQSVRSATDGIVTDVRIRPGQVIAAGGSLVTIATDGARARVVAMLPAHDRPLLRVGGPLRVELAGYRYAYRDTVIQSIGEEAVGPSEVKRFLGSELADTVDVSGPLVLVQADLSSLTFTEDGQTLRYVDGMAGKADASLKKERIVVTLVPALRALFGDPS